MENGIVKSKENELVELEGVKITRGQIDLIKRTIFISATDDEMRLFFYECRRRGVHPMDRLIYPVSRKDKEGNRHVTFQMAIDYLRAAAEETGRYVGQKAIQYGPLIKQMTDEGEISVPEWAEATVLRKDSETGNIAEITHKVFWKEYYPGQKLGHMWRKMPHGQLGKCAEGGDLRKAFPRKLGGLYINEEMEQAEAIPFIPIQMPQEKKNGSESSTENNIIGLVDSIIQKQGETKGKPWTKYIIQIREGQFSTFDKKIFEAAKQAKETGVEVRIEFKPTTYGPEILSIALNIPDENAQ